MTFGYASTLFVVCFILPLSTAAETPTTLFRVSGVEVTFVGSRSLTSTGTVLLTLSIDTKSSFSLGKRYFGIGFVNLPTFQSKGLDMAGPNGSEYFIFHGEEATHALVEYRRLREGEENNEPRYLSSTFATPADKTNASHVSGAHAQELSRIQTMTFRTNGTRHIYEVTLSCGKGKLGVTDFFQGSAVMFARGHYTAHKLLYHSEGVTFRGFNRTGSGRNFDDRPVRLFTFCGPGERVQEPKLTTAVTAATTCYPPSKCNRSGGEAVRGAAVLCIAGLVLLSLAGRFCQC